MSGFNRERIAVAARARGLSFSEMCRRAQRGAQRAKERKKAAARRDAAVRQQHWWKTDFE